MKNIILKFLLFFFCYFSSVVAEVSIYTVKDNQVFLQNDGNVLELREKAKRLAFENAFRILTKKILEPPELRKLQRVDEIQISSLIKDFKIIEEEITDINYKANISVNFNSDLILNLLGSFKIKSKVLVSEEYLVFPVFKKFNTLYLWDNDNIWYDSLLEEYDELGLLKLFFPKKNHMNKLKISAKQILDQEKIALTNFLTLNKKKKAIIIYLEEKYDLDINKVESVVSTKLFYNDEFESIRLFQKDEYRENSELSNTKLISKIIINELQEWWKKKIDSPDFESVDENVFFLKLETSDLKKNILIEKRINEILGKKGFTLHQFNNEQIIYKVKTKYSIDQLNLALEVDNLKLVQSIERDNFFELRPY